MIDVAEGEVPPAGDVVELVAEDAVAVRGREVEEECEERQPAERGAVGGGELLDLLHARILGARGV